MVKNVILLSILVLSVVSCTTIKFKNVVQKKLPDLAAIGVYSDYALEENYQTKTNFGLTAPLLLKKENIVISKRKIFIKNDSLSKPQRDSILVSFEIIDKISLLQQINKQRELVKYLKKGENFRIVTKVTLDYPKGILNELELADEVYLVQNKEKTLSVELRKNNTLFSTVEFSDGAIVDFQASEFCWGSSSGYKVEVMDLIEVGAECNKNTYKSARRAQRKNEIGF